MTNVELFKYFYSKYQSVFKTKYTSCNPGKEIYLLGSLLRKYSEYTILEAIDMFLGMIQQDKATISYFASNNVFSNKFSELIKLDKVSKYRRLSRAYHQDPQLEVNKLLQEYYGYINAISLSNEDVERKQRILMLLEEIDIAERFGVTNLISSK